MKECPACRRCFPDHVNHCPNDGDATTPSIAGEPILDGRYQLEKRLGHGGMGVVFKARHIFLKTAHAIKVILPDLVGNDPMLVTRFRQEALAAAAIRHQNIIAVTDFGVARGTMPFLVMEFVQGKSLHDILAAEGALPPTRALEIMAAIGAGVAAAHRQNIVHRDLKPLNIMLQDGLPVAEAVKILDFGLAKIKSGELLGSFVQAKTSGLMGSPFYMAPEQWSDEEPDVRADIYSLGVILYQMLGGDVPFKGTGIPSIMKKHLTAAPAPLASLGVSVPPTIEAVVRHALEKDADNRPQTVEAFIGELRDAVAQTSASLNRTQMAGPGYQSETIITPAPPPSISMRPQPATTTMRIRTTPARSRVSINSIEVGLSDGNGQMVITDIQPGKHLVRVRHDGYADWEGQIECSGGTCDVSAQLQSLMATSMPQMGSDQFAGTISAPGMDSSQQQSYAAMEAQRLRAQAAQLEEQARREEAERRERERREQEERDRIAREELQREEEARLRAQAEARERAEAEARLKAEEEARRAEEERKRAEAEAQRRAEEQAAREKAEAEAQRRAEEAEAARKHAEAEAAARKKAEEETARLRAEQEESRRLAQQEAARRAEEERLRAEAETRRKAEEEEARRLAEAERVRLEAEAREKAEAESRRRAEEERARREQEQREREERERALQAERERIERERRELEEQRARLAATTVSPPVDLSQTQPQRQGITTGPVDPHAGAQSHPNLGYQSQPQFQSSSPGFAAAAEPKKSGLPIGIIAAVIGIVLLVGGGGGIYLMTRSKTPETPQTPSNPNQKPGDNNNKPPDANAPIKPDLVSLPGGTFQIGRADGAEQEGPPHSVTVGAFAIDRTEVTNAEYAQFVAETNHPAPSHFRGGKPAGGQEQWPVTNVSLEDAKAFAAWRSKRDGVTYRLPTEEEWEYAARDSGQGSLFPWGDKWAEGKANVNAASLKPVGSSADDKTRSGIVDMIGNAYEWTTSKASYYEGSKGQVRPDNKDWIIVRGGAYITDMSKRKISAAFRDWIPATTQNSGLGFRLVRSQ
ncbi:MAG TPA: SUMF1/EgtB/PvdO family nonheme iron enzyme [Pyrinomonadaceae bacterium]|nr:SUMF1/EgtB/PvdO family nonheme iron enzyme [Pyrinomonadaceae bacterium]